MGGARSSPAPDLSGQSGGMVLNFGLPLSAALPIWRPRRNMRRPSVRSFRHQRGLPMSDNAVDLKPKPKTKPKLERPKLYKVILLNDDYTPRDFVTIVLKAVFRMSEETGHRVMMTAHKMG